MERSRLSARVAFLQGVRHLREAGTAGESEGAAHRPKGQILVIPDKNRKTTTSGEGLGQETRSRI